MARSKSALIILENQTYHEIAIQRARVDEKDVYIVRNGPTLDEISLEFPEPALKKGVLYMACYAGVYIGSGDWQAYGTAFVGLLDNPERRTLMGKIGRDRVEGCFQWEHQKAFLLRAHNHVQPDRPKNG